jgi:hypothetical protein
MKRIIALALVGAMVAGSAFAEITFGAWGRARWAPLVVGGDVEPDENGKTSEVTNIGIGGGPGWKGAGAAISFEVNGKNESETVGFNIHMRAHTGTGDLGLGDPHAYLWAKPFGDIFKMRIGLYDEDALRGKFGGVDHATTVVGGQTNAEDAIFFRLRSANMTKGVGALLGFYPVDGLSIFANLGVSGGDNGTPTKYAIGDTLASGQYAIGYNISGIGLARFQFIGGTYGKEANYSPLGGDAKSWNQIQLAFNLTAVDKLNIDFGATIPLAIEQIKRDTIVAADGDTPAHIAKDAPLPLTVAGFSLGEGSKYSAPIHIAFAAKYDLSPIVVQARVDAELGESFAPKTGDKFEGGTDIAFALLPTYKVDGVGTLGARVAIKLTGTDKQGSDLKNDKTDLGLSVYFDRDIFPGFNFAIGLASNIPLSGGAYDGELNTATAAKAVAKAQAFKLAIPIAVTYSL